MSTAGCQRLARVTWWRWVSSSTVSLIEWADRTIQWTWTVAWPLGWPLALFVCLSVCLFVFPSVSMLLVNGKISPPFVALSAWSADDWTEDVNAMLSAWVASCLRHSLTVTQTHFCHFASNYLRHTFRKPKMGCDSVRNYYYLGQLPLPSFLSSFFPSFHSPIFLLLPLSFISSLTFLFYYSFLTSIFHFPLRNKTSKIQVWDSRELVETVSTIFLRKKNYYEKHTALTLYHWHNALWLGMQF